MKTLVHWCVIGMLGMTKFTARADVEVKLSVKFIHSSTGAAPVTVPGDGNIDLSTRAAFDVEIEHANRVLNDTGRGYKVRVIEYVDIQPPAPADQVPDFWYNLYARENVRVFEEAALAAPVTWAWHGNGALNIYVNNSGSGQSSRPGHGYTISMGSTIYSRGTVLHEIGHFFDLSHTQGFDPDNPDNECVFGDGDGLIETLPDNGCFDTIDQLCMANFGGKTYQLLNDGEKAMINDTWYNAMSYHEEARLLQIQMDYWAINANLTRQEVCTGRTFFVKPTGFDFHDGLSTGSAVFTIDRGLELLVAPPYVHLGDDVLLLHTGTYVAPQAVIDIPCTISAAYGPVTLTRP